MRLATTKLALTLGVAAVATGCASRVATGERLQATARGEGAVLEASAGEQRFLGRERVATLIKVNSLTVGARGVFVFQRVLDPGASLGRHRHELDDEVIFVHSGELTASGRCESR